jgi:hypothetical protein
VTGDPDVVPPLFRSFIWLDLRDPGYREQLNRLVQELRNQRGHGSFTSPQDVAALREALAIQESVLHEQTRAYSLRRQVAERYAATTAAVAVLTTLLAAAGALAAVLRDRTTSLSLTTLLTAAVTVAAALAGYIAARYALRDDRGDRRESGD